MTILIRKMKREFHEEVYMAVSNGNYELQVQETILRTAIDIQVALRILVEKGIVSRDEVAAYRKEVFGSPKYKVPMDDIQRQKAGFQAAKDNPQEYLSALFKAKMNGDIR